MSPPVTSLAAASLIVVVWAIANWAARADGAARARGRLRADQVRPHGPPPWFVDTMMKLRLGADSEWAWPVARVGVVAMTCWMAWTSPAVAVAAVLATGLGLAIAPAVLRFRRLGGGDDGLPAVIEVMVGELGSGSSLLQGLDRAATGRADGLGADLAQVVRRSRQGTLLQGALDAWVADAPGPARSLFVDALALAGSSGGSQVQALRGVAATLREREELQREVMALGSQARASATVLVVTPVAFAVTVGVADPAVGAFLLGTPAGWACLAIGFMLDAFGAWWMHRLVVALR